MLAFITGASSGIGRDMAKVLAHKGYDLIITARDEEKLFELRNEILNESRAIKNKKDETKEQYSNLQINIKIITANLENENEVFRLYEKIKNENIDLFINNAGFGNIGNFWDTDLETEINMIKVNDIAMHILFKLVLRDMIKNINETAKEINEKYILNVSSLSGYMPGPKMATYYSTKAYMLNLTKAVYKELKMEKQKVNISVLCPGPIYTNFADRAGVKFKTIHLTSEYTAKYAISKLFEKKLVIIPGFINKCGHVLSKLIPSKIVMAVTYRIQDKKVDK